ncbi:MAG: histidinol-phosphate transaminase [Ignavibacteria bacterium]|nr:histidinol-phosphate transaminase [Ignavibacteria bacterium]
MGQILLDRNENQYGPAPTCYRALREANLLQMSMYSRDYLLARKSELSYRLSHQFGIPENRLLLSYGSEDMLKQTVHCYLKPGETMLSPRQSWWYYKSIAKEVGGKQVEYALHEKGHKFEYSIEEMLRLCDIHHPQLILIASPNNPTGNSIRKEDLIKLIEYCKSSVIVLDEAYFGFSNERRNDIKKLLESHGLLVILRTFSKYYALAGLRIGYACVGEDVTHLTTYSARYLGYNQLTEKIALAALDDEEYYHSITQKMCEDKESYYREFASLEGFTPFHSDANFILVRYPILQKQYLESELRRRNIVLKFLSDPGLEDCIRITVGTKEQNAFVISSMKEIVKLGVSIPSQPAFVKG